MNEIHIYDSDFGSEHRYKKYIDKINSRGGENEATETNLPELENYVHPGILKEEYGIDLLFDENWTCLDVPRAIAKFNHEHRRS